MAGYLLDRLRMYFQMTWIVVLISERINLMTLRSLIIAPGFRFFLEKQAYCFYFS